MWLECGGKGGEWQMGEEKVGTRGKLGKIL